MCHKVLVNTCFLFLELGQMYNFLKYTKKIAGKIFNFYFFAQKVSKFRRFLCFYKNFASAQPYFTQVNGEQIKIVKQ